jgi:hypothetical protein
MDVFREFASMRFQGEVAGVKEANNCARNVALERLGARRQNEWVVLAPLVRPEQRAWVAPLVSGSPPTGRRQPLPAEALGKGLRV